LNFSTRGSAWDRCIRANLGLVAVVTGILLPIDFLSQLDGYLIYLRPRELAPVWAWAWLLYGTLGLALGLCATLASLTAAAVFRRNILNWIKTCTDWLAFSLVALCLVRGGKLWIEAYSNSTTWWLSRHQNAIVAITLIGCAIGTRYWNIERLQVQKIAKLGAAGGALAALVCALVLLIAGPATSLPRYPAVSASESKHPNIILLTCDALAANHTSLAGYSRPTTPNLEKLAHEASVFERYYANSNFTTPTVNSMVNGVRPWTHRANQGLARVSIEIANNGLIARLKRAGYQTYAVWTNPIAAPSHIQNDRRMDAIAYGQAHASLEDLYAMVNARFPHFGPAASLGTVVASCKFFDLFQFWLGLSPAGGQYDPTSAFASARALVEQADPSRPMFLWVHLLRPHNPYATPPPFFGRFDQTDSRRTRFDSSPPYLFLAAAKGDNAIAKYAGRYDEAVLCADFHIGQFVEWLKTKGLFDDSLIVVSADHGESFSHNYGGHGGPMLHEDLIHIPLLIREPRQTTGQRLDTLSEQIDLMPTILELAGVPVTGTTEGRSLKPALRGQNMTGTIFSMNFEQSSRFSAPETGTVAVLEGHWKYVQYLGHPRYPQMPKLKDGLYDLQSDLGEETNLIAEQPAIATRLRQAIQDQLSLHGGPLP